MQQVKVRHVSIFSLTLLIAAFSNAVKRSRLYTVSYHVVVNTHIIVYCILIVSAISGHAYLKKEKTTCLLSRSKLQFHDFFFIVRMFEVIGRNQLADQG